MTVKDLAEFSGKTDRTVQGWVKKASEINTLINEKSSLSSPMYPADYSIDEVELILNQSRLGVNAVCILMANAREKKNSIVPSVESKPDFDYQALGLVIGQAVAAAMAPIVSRLDLIEYQNKPALPAPPKTGRKALNQIVREYAQERLNGDYRKAWNNLYKEFYYRTDLKIKTEADHWDCTPIEYLENTDHLDDAIAIVKELMGE
jgi:hypothetical protein